MVARMPSTSAKVLLADTSGRPKMERCLPRFNATRHKVTQQAATFFLQCLAEARCKLPLYAKPAKGLQSRQPAPAT